MSQPSSSNTASRAPGNMNGGGSHPQTNRRGNTRVTRRYSGTPWETADPERRRSVGGDGEPDDFTQSENHAPLNRRAFRTSSPSSLAGSPIITTGDPHHQRAPSLGELHQELENEQEAQVNRLLQMIRSQQTQLQQLQQHSGTHSSAVDESAQLDRSSAIPPVPPLPALSGTSNRSSLSVRRPSRPPSQTASPPSLRPLADHPRGPETLEWVTGTSPSHTRRSSRDETAFYQAEAAMLGRENQILRQRIRELERQVSELTVSAADRSATPPAAEGAATADPHATAGVGSAGEFTDKP
ncbi:hypothetical protein BDV59DRAFT_202111 [Aspergillus ambiguus]|uniref:uncharacterized protein n=1 Tax=Aspergillus ambiguus TaxID=176160 RepID=UPI003CCE40DB